jgi:hypothetical protein
VTCLGCYFRGHQGYYREHSLGTVPGHTWNVKHCLWHNLKTTHLTLRPHSGLKELELIYTHSSSEEASMAWMWLPKIPVMEAWSQGSSVGKE